jgi:formate/nitrite transporter
MRRGHVASLDPILPPEMARRLEDVGVAKSKQPISRQFALAILAGAFISLGAVFSTTVSVGTADKLGFGITKLIAGFTFCLGLVLVVVAGAELFTGNTLIVNALMAGRVKLVAVLRSWGVVLVGNATGALATAFIMHWTGLLTGPNALGGGAVGDAATAIATAKCNLSWGEAFWRATMCNALVCLAVWLCFSAHTTTDKIISVVFPITAFVAAGFEHSVANMYFIPVGILSAGESLPAGLGWDTMMINNLIPVTLGNIFGGVVLVG